jgi:hypothetical protein
VCSYITDRGNATDLSLLTNLSHTDIQDLQSVGREAQAKRKGRGSHTCCARLSSLTAIQISSYAMTKMRYGRI